MANEERDTLRESAEGNSPPPPEQRKKRRGPKLNSLKNARDFLGRVIRELKAGELDPRRANSLVYAISAWVDVAIVVQAEDRMAAIEMAIAQAREVAQH